MKKLLYTIILVPLLSTAQLDTTRTVLTQWKPLNKDFQKVELTNLKLKEYNQIFSVVSVAWLAAAILTENNSFLLNSAIWGGFSLGTSIAINERRKRIFEK